ncbi:meiotic recombination protein REC8 homolog [Leuresthes tenuis]|uniref:meiotic recombination protein REC8 homolog n=1 Tax=Leuresthes tenuis TaxID=355514 RepID=UPI003B5137BF
MFYYPVVLKHHTGCFSTIWLVATKGIKVPRRDFLKVNVKSTCDDIMNYVLERVPAPRPGLPRPRFSLYLSSQLQYGVVVVYHRQCVILLEELQSVVGQFLKQLSSRKIDMDDHSRQALNLPDALSLLEETEGALDPLFGVMQLQEPMPSPRTLIEMGREYLREASPEYVRSPESARPAAAELEAGITASPESITLREMEPATIPTAEFEGEDLIDHHPDTISFLLAQADHFPEGGLELPREDATPREQESEQERGGRDQEEERTKEQTGSTTELQPTTVSSEDGMMSPQQEPDLPVEAPRPPRDQLTPVSVPEVPLPSSAARERRRRLRSLQLEDVPPAARKRRRRRKRRQLIFFDPETQLSQEELEQQINDPLIETKRSHLLTPSSGRVLTASELLNNPCNFLPDEVLFLWRQAATITPLSGADLLVGERGPESTDSEREREREVMEVAEREEQRLELSPEEVQREMVESEMFDISAPGILPLEASDQQEVSQEISSVHTSEREGSIISRSVSTLQDIPEVMDELIERFGAQSPGLLPELAELEVEPVLFHSLLPPEANRRTVSKLFQKLLESLTARKLCVEQDQPYGDILIFPGSNYEEAFEAS